MFPAMAVSRPPSLLIWLAAVLLVALGVVVPGAAAAHAGHGEHPGRTATWHAAEPSGPAAPVASGAVAALQEEASRGVAVVATGDNGTPAPCGGAACCTSGHGCCAAIPVADAAAPTMPGAARLRTHVAGLPPGVTAPALPEPPRPFR